MLKVFKKVAPIVGRTLASEAAGLGRLAVRGAPRAAMAVARTNPYCCSGYSALFGSYIKRDELAEVGAAIADDPHTQAAYEQLIAGGEQVQQTLQPFAELSGLPGIRPLARLKPAKRKISKANRAVKEGMKILERGR